MKKKVCQQMIKHFCAQLVMPFLFAERFHGLELYLHYALSALIEKFQVYLISVQFIARNCLINMLIADIVDGLFDR